MARRGHSNEPGWLRSGLIRSSMMGKALRPTDEELGKKDDDHKPGARGGFLAHVTRACGLAVPTLRLRRRRILLVVVGVYLLYLLADAWLDLSALPFLDADDDAVVVEKEPVGAPPGIKLPAHGTTLNTFSGQIKFYRLSETLQGAAHTNGYSHTNRNVLFAMSSLKSAAILIPLICEMSRWKRNWVHAAIMGRDDIPIEDLLDINGVDRTECPAIWHDARPSYTEYSTEERAETSVTAALGHFHTFQHPQVIITNDEAEEDGFFTRAIRAKASKLGTPVVEIPKDRTEDFMWVTRLDSGSLRNWHKPELDILIQAPSHASGGIIKLLQCLKEADYTGLRAPRITIELPADVDDAVSQYLENYPWPPRAHESSSSSLGSGQITLRRRINAQHRTQEESAIRFLELFYPSNKANSHVLVLSPQIELSPLYFHYVNYLLLEYKYSAYGESDSYDLMGAALELPSTLLDGKTKLAAPKPSDMRDERYGRLFSSAASAPFLWQAPNSHAALFFGDKWAEFHSFLSHRVRKQHQAGGKKKAGKAKLVSEAQPAWTEYLLELLRARGYSFLYPATSSAECFVTVHDELFHAPEEFQQASSPSSSSTSSAPEAGAALDMTPSAADEAFTRAETPASRNPHHQDHNAHKTNNNNKAPAAEAATRNAEPAVVIPRSRALHLALPFDGDLPEVPHLPLLLYSGHMASPRQARTEASRFADDFRSAVGECPSPPPRGKQRLLVAGSAQDLFCFGDEDDELDWVDEVHGARDGDGDGAAPLRSGISAGGGSASASASAGGSSSSSSTSDGRIGATSTSPSAMASETAALGLGLASPV